MSQAAADHNTEMTVAEVASKALAAQAVMDDPSVPEKAAEYRAAVHVWADARDAIAGMLASTLAECRAKARVLLTDDESPLAISLARDILALDAAL